MTTIRLTDTARPVLSIGRDAFLSQVDESSYWGVPRQYFDIEGDNVYLAPRLAAQLDWQLDGRAGGRVNIAAIAQAVTIDGNTLQITPGFFCSYVDEADIAA